MGTRIVLLAFGVGLMALAGCAGKGEVMTLEIQMTPPATEATAKKPDGLRIAVAAFEDARPETKRLGTRTHLWGGETYFDVPGGKPAEVVPPVIADYLKQEGWRAEVAKAGGASGAGSPDVMLTGKLLDMSVNAKSRVFSTKITATTKMAIQAKNTADGSIVRLTLSGEGSQSVFWFDPEDAQRLINDILTDSLEKLLTNTKVENNLLRLK
ncbi:MAG: hypothetical protein ACREIE_06790 [Nitrospiraceae bacterium]